MERGRGDLFSMRGLCRNNPIEEGSQLDSLQLREKKKKNAIYCRFEVENRKCSNIPESVIGRD